MCSQEFVLVVLLERRRWSGNGAGPDLLICISSGLEQLPARDFEGGEWASTAAAGVDTFEEAEVQDLACLLGRVPKTAILPDR
jgi:hypothetical protein